MLFGLYRGFIQSVLNLAGGLAAFAGSFWLFPKLADVLSTNTEITRIISTYTDSGTLLGDLDLSSLSVSALSQDSIASIVEREGLNADQRAHVASVFYNRLAGKLDGLRYLNSDATMMYVTGG